MRDDRARLLDILEAIAKIEQRVAAGKEQFLADELLQVWMIHHIQIIGEAASRLSPTLRESASTIPWDDVIAMRNVLVHQYFGVDLEEVWSTVTGDIPHLREVIEHLVNEPTQ
ncbi:MAG TPA: DUF86 domain-containing protein [bacterium]